MAYVDEMTGHYPGQFSGRFSGDFSARAAARGLGGRLRRGLAKLLETPFDQRYRQRAAEIAALRAKSDGDLAAMGLTRDDILTHVFGTLPRAAADQARH